MVKTGEVTYIKLDDVKSENIQKNIIYQIYEKKYENDCFYSIWGENNLLIKDTAITFTINKTLPFKYYRGVISLESKTKLYIKLLRDFFNEDDTINIDISSDFDDDNNICCIIDISSTDIDITKFMCKILGFEYLFEENLNKIEEKVESLIS